MAANNGPSLTSTSPDAERRDGRLYGRAHEWLTRKMACGFLPVPESEAECRRRCHQLHDLYAEGDTLRTELARVAPSAPGAEARQLGEQLERAVEEVRLQLESLQARSGIAALVAAGIDPARVTLTPRADYLEIRIAPWRNPFLSAVLPLWVVASGALCLTAAWGLSGRGPLPWGLAGFLLVAVPLAFLSYYSVLYWLWIRKGTEALRVSNTELRLEADLWHWHGERTFRREDVRHLRHSRPRQGEAGNSTVLGVARVSSPTVAFTCEGRTWRFGSELDEASALAIIAAVEQRPG